MYSTKNVGREKKTKLKKTVKKKKACSSKESGLVKGRWGGGTISKEKGEKLGVGFFFRKHQRISLGA